MGVPLDQIHVDGQAMWLQEAHRSANKEASDKRGTTGWGIGAATAEKVLRRPGTRLIKDCAGQMLGVHMCKGAITVNEWEGPGLFEGSQGALLSLDQGIYPYCTGKNVTAPAMCAELGISMKRVRRIIGVVRAVPMRVPGASGPSGGAETSYDEIEKLTGITIPQAVRMQGDMTKETEERVFHFSMEDMVLSHLLNGYDALALTFADYHRPGNYQVHDYGDLHADTKKLIERLEDMIAPVILVRTGPEEGDNIWLHDWEVTDE
jgi:adenylosuccinate synthase